MTFKVQNCFSNQGRQHVWSTTYKANIGNNNLISDAPTAAFRVFRAARTGLYLRGSVFLFCGF